MRIEIRDCSLTALLGAIISEQSRMACILLKSKALGIGSSYNFGHCSHQDRSTLACAAIKGQADRCRSVLQHSLSNVATNLRDGDYELNSEDVYGVKVLMLALVTILKAKQMCVD